MELKKNNGMKTIDETLLIPVLEEGGKLYHLYISCWIAGNLWWRILGHRKIFFE